MTTNRDVRLKWDAEETFKRLNKEDRRIVEPHQYKGAHAVPYTHPSNISAERLASLRRMEPVKKPERNIEALRAAAFEPGSTPEKPIPKKGRTDNDALESKYGGVAERPIASAPRASGSASASREAHDAGLNPAAPIPDGARGGVWPKYEVPPGLMWVSCYDAKGKGRYFYDNRTTGNTTSRWVDSWLGTQAQFIAKLREWKHPALAEFEAQPRKQVEGRVWRKGDGLFVVTQSQGHVKWRPEQSWRSGVRSDVDYYEAPDFDYTELHGPEADAIIRECAKAMGLDHGTR